MDLASTLGLADRERALVSFVGAGGKKTAMGRLVTESAGSSTGDGDGDRDWDGNGDSHRDGNGDSHRIGYTTTTHMPPPDGIPLVLAAPATPPWPAEGPAEPLAFARERVGDPERARRKVRGYDPGTVDALFADGAFDWLLVKADGARRREVKAPGPDEPVVPARSTDVVVVASVHAVGEPIAAPTVHRPERVARLCDRAVGEPLTAAALGAVLASEAGGLKGVPADARAHLLVNKADTPALREAGQRVVAAVDERTDRYATTLVAALGGPERAGGESEG